MQDVTRVPSNFVLVIGDETSLAAAREPREANGAPAGPGGESAAVVLRQLGAHVQTAGFWDDFTRALDAARGATCRVVVVEAGERPDFAELALRAARRDARLRDLPALIALPERQVTRYQPSGGFDDFILFPYVPSELYARIRQLEWKASEFSTEERIKMGRLVVDRVAHEVTLDGRRVVMTAKEFSLLAFLMANRGRVFRREQLLARVWGAAYEGGARTVDIHVRRLRAKLGEALPLETLRGAGYKLRAPDQLPDEDSPGRPTLRAVRQGAASSAS